MKLLLQARGLGKGVIRVLFQLIVDPVRRIVVTIPRGRVEALRAGLLGNDYVPVALLLLLYQACM